MTEEIENYELLKKYALDNGASVFGVADIKQKKQFFNLEPPELLEKLDYAISIGFHLSDMVFESLVDRPNKLYYRHYKMANMLLDQMALKTGEQIQRRGYDYIPIPASQLLDWAGNTSHGSHRAIGVLAGLGWRGRSSLLVNPQYGARLRYVSILTDMPLKTDKPLEMGCGKCRACAGMCPAGAIHDDYYDVDACNELLKHFGKTLHVSLICGICQKACRGENPLWEKGDKNGNT